MLNYISAVIFIVSLYKIRHTELISTNWKIYGVKIRFGKSITENNIDSPICSTENFDSIAMCDICSVVKRPDIVHCETCHSCVEGFDHHYTILATCLGIQNIKYFVQTIAYAGF